MIAKMIKGRGFRGALEYDLTKEKGRVIDSNMAGQNPRELAAEFGQIRKLRPTLGKAVLHVSLSAAPGEHLTDDQWREIGQRYLRGMGFTDTQYLITRHTDTEHEHVHILANRIRFDGSVVSDSQDYRRQEALMREIEQEYGLQRVAPSIEAERRAPTKGEIERAVRTGQPSTRQRLQQICDACMLKARTFTEYVELLEEAGVDVIPVAQMEGAKLSGLSYRLDGVVMKGSDLGKKYAAAGIQKRGISYEKDRDFETVRRCCEQEAFRVFGDPDRDFEAGPSPERRGLGLDAGAAGPRDGNTHGRDETGPDRHAADAGHDRAQAAGASRESFADSSTDAERAPLDNSDRGGLVGYPRSGPRERILALASTSAQDADQRKGKAPRDRSIEAVQRQIAALGVARFEVGIRDAQTGKMLNREWSADELKRSVAWLKRMNARGSDIYVRPAGEHGLVLIDDLSPQALDDLRRDGLSPAAVIETSPNNFQAWIKLSDTPLPAAVRRMAAQDLARRYGGDPNSADARHYGRLAGFTNQKPQYASGGLHPYVLARGCSGKVAEAAQAYLERLQFAETPKPKPQERHVMQERHVIRPCEGDPVREYRKMADGLMRRYGADADLSRVDWMCAVSLARRGYSVQDIEGAMRQASPDLETRKAGHIDDYVSRTAEKAWAEVHQDERQAERRPRPSFSP